MKMMYINRVPYTKGNNTPQLHIGVAKTNEVPIFAYVAGITTNDGRGKIGSKRRDCVKTLSEILEYLSEFQ